MRLGGCVCVWGVFVCCVCGRVCVCVCVCGSVCGVGGVFVCDCLVV